MAGPSAAATRSCSPERGLTRRPCRGLLEAALEHVAAFHEIGRRRIPLLAPDPEHQRDQTATAATTRSTPWRTSWRRETAGRASCEAATGLPGPRIDVTDWPAQRRSHSGTLVGISTPRGVPRSPAGNQHATTAPAQHSQATCPHRRRPRSTYRQLSTHARHG